MELLFWKVNMIIYDIRFWIYRHSPSNLNIDKHVKLQIQHGLVYSDLCPKRCPCGCKEQVEHDKDYMGYQIMEYSVKCKKCGAGLGHWAYGYWQV